MCFTLETPYCILDIYGNAFKSLGASRLFPIAVYLKPKSFIVSVTYRRQTPRLEQDFV